MHEYTGAAHIHSSFSDGSGKVDEIAEIASESGLDFILLTDHNTLRAKKEGYEGYYGNTLLLVGAEINDRYNKNHYLAFNIDDTPSTRIPACEYVNEIKNNNGFGFIAHPHEKRSSMTEHPPYPWTAWNCEDFDGIEIWNHMSEWMEGLTEDNKYNYFVHPLRSIEAPPKATLDKWDELNQKRKVVGIGGIDAHAHKVNLLGFIDVEVFPYKVLFKSIRTHVLLNEKLNKQDFNSGKNLIYSALKYGRSFISNDYRGDSSGFRFYAETEKNIFGMGDAFPLQGKINLKVLLPKVSGNIRLIRNGRKISSVDNHIADFKIDKPGAYRVEVFLDNKAWIFSNHIRIGI